ncbi:hypothetical protein A2307_05950 [Candidatus Peregrinibacteria bacterium RIFOXYB2_FULL_33_20]|nr:MAG: hypothetical protein A2263_02695 [Candidatus Peregrinibacteria bacterium RIFOXYA2_FULL_33_21]OGJ50752.1 MAG: hypothetical protein A2307_05950 [Candidatus Peregrinibacteria bacterium RIFOXYB2_FULL_33_20]
MCTLKISLLISIAINILFLVALCLYLFTPIFDVVILHLSLPRVCEYAVSHDAYEERYQKLFCNFILDK